MNKNLTKIKYSLILLLLISILTFTVIGCSKSSANVIKSNDQVNEVNAEDLDLTLEGYGAKGALADQDMSIADMLMYAAQDEYLAKAEYAAIIDEYDVTRPYSNIMKAEETHLNYLKEVYETYNMEFPKDESSAQLVIPTSLLEAAQVGVQAEIDNIAMYKQFLTYDLPEDIENVFDALIKGSENHLSAFQNQVDKLI